MDIVDAIVAILAQRVDPLLGAGAAQIEGSVIALCDRAQPPIRLVELARRCGGGCPHGDAAHEIDRNLLAHATSPSLVAQCRREGPAQPRRREISSAVSSTARPMSSRRAAPSKEAVWPLTLTAATGSPAASKTAAATELMPASKKPSLQARPSARSASRRLRSWTIVTGVCAVLAGS